MQAHKTVKTGIDVKNINIEALRIELVGYLRTATQIIKDRQKNLLTKEYIKRLKLPDAAILNTFGVTHDNLIDGYTNSAFLVKINHVQVEGAGMYVFPELSYLLREGVKASAAIHDLLTNERLLIVIDDRLALRLSQYYAVLTLLQNHLGLMQGQLIFDEIFTSDKSKMLLSSLDIKLGTRDYHDCINAYKAIYINPMIYFIQNAADVIQMGDMLSFECTENKMQYAVIGGMTENNQLLFDGLNIPADSSQEEMALLLQAINHQHHRRKQSKKKVSNKPPCASLKLDPLLHYQFHFDRIRQLLLTPAQALEKIKVYFDVENKQVVNIREHLLPSVMQLISNPINGKLTGHEKLSAPIPTIFEDNIDALRKTYQISFDLGVSSLNERDYDKAENFLSRALLQGRMIFHFFDRQNIQSELLECHSRIAVNCYHLGLVHKEKGNYKKSIVFLKEAHELTNGFFDKHENNALIDFIQIHFAKRVAVILAEVRLKYLENEKARHYHNNSNRFFTQTASQAATSLSASALQSDGTKNEPKNCLYYEKNKKTP